MDNAFRHRVLHRLFDGSDPAVDGHPPQRTTIGRTSARIFRIFGRDAGFTACMTAYVASVRCCIPDAPFQLQKLIDLLGPYKIRTKPTIR